MAKPAIRYNKKTGEYAVTNAAGEVEIISSEQFKAQEMGSLGAAGAGVGRTLEKWAGGALDAYYGITGQGQSEVVQGEGMRSALREVGGEQAAAFAPIAEANPISSGLGQALPYLATAPLGGASVWGQAALAGTTAALETSGGVGERLRAGGTGTALGFGGAVGGNMAARVVNQIAGRGRTTAAQQFQKMGGKVTPGQALESRGLRRLETVLEAGGVLDPLKEANEILMQKQAGKAIGQADNAIDISSTGLGNSADDIGVRINNALDDVPDINITDDLLADMRQVKGDSPYIKFPDETTNTMTSQEYQQIRSQMAGVARTEAATATKTPGKLEFVQDIIDQLDQKFITAAKGTGKAEQLGQAREHWRNLLALERGQAVTPDGFVNPRSLNTALNSVWKKTYRRGKYDRVRPETKELMQGTKLQAGRELGSVVGDSGTATRIGLGVGMPLGIGALVGLGSNPIFGAAATAASIPAAMIYRQMGGVLSRLPANAQFGRQIGQGLMSGYQAQQ